MIQLPPYFDEMLADNRDPSRRAGGMRQAVDQFMGPGMTEPRPLLDPEIALLAGMPELAQYGMAQQRRFDQSRQGDQETAMKLLSLLQASQSQDDRTAMGWSGLQQDDQQFAGKMGMDAMRMGLQGEQMRQQEAIANMSNQLDWAQLMERQHSGEADRMLRMQALGQQGAFQENQGLAQLIRALGERDRMTAMGEAYRAQAAGLAPKAAPGATAQPQAEGGSNWPMILGILALAGGGIAGKRMLANRAAAKAAGKAGGVVDDAAKGVAPAAQASEETVSRARNYMGSWPTDDVFRGAESARPQRMPGGSASGGFGGLLNGPPGSIVDDVIDGEFSRPTSPVEQLLLMLKGPESKAAQPWSPYMAVDPALESAMAARAAAGPKVPGTPPGRGFSLSYPSPAIVPGAASPPLEAIFGQMDPRTAATLEQISRLGTNLQKMQAMTGLAGKPVGGITVGGELVNEPWALDLLRMMNELR